MEQKTTKKPTGNDLIPSIEGQAVGRETSEVELHFKPEKTVENLENDPLRSALRVAM